MEKISHKLWIQQPVTVKSRHSLSQYTNLHREKPLLPCFNQRYAEKECT